MGIMKEEFNKLSTKVLCNNELCPHMKLYACTQDILTLEATNGMFLICRNFHSLPESELVLTDEQHELNMRAKNESRPLTDLEEAKQGSDYFEFMQNLYKVGGDNTKKHG